jgi:hypothetical protein
MPGSPPGRARRRESTLLPGTERRGGGGILGMIPGGVNRRVVQKNGVAVFRIFAGHDLAFCVSKALDYSQYIIPGVSQPQPGGQPLGSLQRVLPQVICFRSSAELIVIFFPWVFDGNLIPNGIH